MLDLRFSVTNFSGEKSALYVVSSKNFDAVLVWAGTKALKSSSSLLGFFGVNSLV